MILLLKVGKPAFLSLPGPAAQPCLRAPTPFPWLSHLPEAKWEDGLRRGEGLLRELLASLDSSKCGELVVGTSWGGDERESMLQAGKDPEPSLMSDTSNKSCIFPKSDF